MARTGMVKMPPRLVAITSSSASAVFPPTACSPASTFAVFEEWVVVMHAGSWLDVQANIAQYTVVSQLHVVSKRGPLRSDTCAHLGEGHARRQGCRHAAEDCQAECELWPP